MRRSVALTLARRQQGNSIGKASKQAGRVWLATHGSPDGLAGAAVPASPLSSTGPVDTSGSLRNGCTFKFIRINL